MRRVSQGTRPLEYGTGRLSLLRVAVSPSRGISQSKRGLILPCYELPKSSMEMVLYHIHHKTQLKRDAKPSLKTFSPRGSRSHFAAHDCTRFVEEFYRAE
eukprot:scaffold3498_cov176-Amphora_coffeaeformis.AAC.19